MPDAGIDEQELEYYRAIEDFFAALRGVPHTLSPKDFQLLRSWWRDGVPLAAVRAGINDVVARRRERGDEEPVVSLSYCRHAVRAQAHRLAAAHVGDGQAGATATETPVAAVRALARHLAEAAAEQADLRPRVAAVLHTVGEQIATVAELPAAAAEEQLYALETTLLAACHEALEADERHALTEQAEAAAGTSASASAVAAHRDRMLRKMLRLPRLELP